MMNVGLYYYKTYYNSLRFKPETGEPIFDGGKITQEPNKMLLGASLVGLELKSEIKKLANVPHLVLKTTYPGLLVGSGTPHEIGSDGQEENDYLVKNELRLGLFFDHISGLPIIPGSSIKGVLRHAFDHPAYVVEWLNEIYANNRITGKAQTVNWEKCTTEEKEKHVNKLKEQIFKGEGTNSPYERDVFCDAFPTAGANLFGTDYITHHKDPLKAPNPVQFLKVLPNITYSFHFRLFDAELPVLKRAEKSALKLTAFQKRCLFLALIQDLGLGAKTNVGYGQFEVNNWYEDEKVKEYNPEKDIPDKPIIAEPVGPSVAEKLKTELTTNGLEKPLREATNFNRVKHVISQYQKNSENALDSEKERIFQTLKRIIKVELENNQTKRKWNKLGNGNWHKIAEWFDHETAQNWYERLML